ncbi:glycosyl transferase family protein, partial [Mycobacterium terramassiliense]
VTARAAICLNMIVKNEADVVAETLDSVAPYISSWVIVDTGSADGTQDAIRKRMARLGIPGELHERPWRNFGHNRTEALNLAQGHGDYIWVIDADDIVVGTPEFTELSADIYRMRLGDASFTYWRPQLFRDGVRVRYEGVVHETAVWESDCVVGRLEGDYYVESRRLGARSQDPQKYARDRDLLLAEVERNPENARSVFYLAQSYFDLGDFANARKWYERRVEMGGSDEEVYYSMLRLAESMAGLDWPWLVVQDVYLQAWEFRPTRAEALYAIARRYREQQRYLPGHLFAQRAAQIPFPEKDLLFVGADIYAWRAVDEQAVCASQLGKHAEAFMLCRRLLALSDIPDGDRQRIAVNRDVSVPVMLEAAASYPDALVQRLVPGSGAKVVVSLIAGPDRETTEQAINSFLNCCLDLSIWFGRLLVVDAGLSALDRALLRERYGFLEFVDCGPGDSPATQLAQLRAQILGRFWLHLGQGWQFFAPENFITRLIAVLESEPQVFQVGINFADAVKLTGVCAAEQEVRRENYGGRYVLTDAVASGPALFDTARLDRAGGIGGSDPDPIAELGWRAAAVGLQTATLDEVLCIAAARPVRQPKAPARVAKKAAVRSAQRPKAPARVAKKAGARSVQQPKAPARVAKKAAGRSVQQPKAPVRAAKKGTARPVQPSKAPARVAKKAAGRSVQQPKAPVRAAKKGTARPVQPSKAPARVAKKAAARPVRQPKAARVAKKAAARPVRQPKAPVRVAKKAAGRPVRQPKAPARAAKKGTARPVQPSKAPARVAKKTAARPVQQPKAAAPVAKKGRRGKIPPQ